jgi:hypothetical protein
MERRKAQLDVCDFVKNGESNALWSFLSVYGYQMPAFYENSVAGFARL